MEKFNRKKGNTRYIAKEKHKERDKMKDITIIKHKIPELQALDFYDGIVKITRKAKPGPVVFSVTDGYGMVDAVIKDSDYETDDTVHITGDVLDRAGKLQIEIKTIKNATKNFDAVINERAIPARQEFSIESGRYEKMKPKFIEIAIRLRKAMIEGQPIIIRHHNDADGITSGLSIEKACKAFMKSTGSDPEYFIYRSPSKAPFYEITDVFRDIVMSKRIESHDQKKPLIIIVDNGSTPEDMAGFRILKTLGYEAIVVDHHNPVIFNEDKTKTAVCQYLGLHLNPYLYGLDSQTSAGMMCYELGRFIFEGFDDPIMPAVAAIADRCNIPETDAYIKKAGLSKEDIAPIGVAIDFTAYHMRFDPGKGVFEELYHNKELVKVLNEEVRENVETQLQSTLPYLRTQEVNGVLFSYIDLEKYTLRFTYPTPGKVLGMIHDTVTEGKEHAALTLGYLSDMIIIRATKPILPVQAIIDNLRKDLPEANVDGGGHEMAGTIKFVQAHLEIILQKIKEMLRERKIA